MKMKAEVLNLLRVNKTFPKREIRTTSDGSSTIFVAELDEHYHSIHGAIQESKHVFIEAGLKYFIDQYQPEKIKIYEVGFGTGLNALLTANFIHDTNVKIEYFASEAYPLNLQEIESLNYTDEMEQNEKQLFLNLHKASWNEKVKISDQFTLCKQQEFLENRAALNSIDIVYFDAFAPSAQPELWTESIFKRINNEMSERGILVTYCAKGVVKRTLKSSGFKIEAIPGPPGKREMTRAFVNHE